MHTKETSLQASHRLEDVGFSDIVVIRDKVMKLREAGEKVFGFHGGEPFFDTPFPIKQAAELALSHNETRYAPASGIAPLRKALADKLQSFNKLDASPEDVIVTCGGAHALFAAFQSALNAGDDVLVFSPYWTPIRDMIVAAQARPVLVPTETALRQGLTVALEQFLTPATTAIYFNTPQNPNGLVFSRADAEQVAAFAIRHNLIVIADEAYEDLVYEGEHFSIASLPGMKQRTISTYTFSKSYSMTGWRVGYAVAPEPFMTALRKMVLYSTNGVPTMLQWAALEALKRPRTELEKMRDEYRKRRDTLVEGIRNAGFECTTPAGAFYAFPDTTPIGQDSRKVATLLLDEAHVASIPGIVFGTHGESHLRMSYSVSPEVLEGGIQALGRMRSLLQNR